MFKIGDKVHFQDDSGNWSKKVFTVTGFITDEEMKNELNRESSYTQLQANGKSKSVTEKLYKSEDEIRNTYLDWDCYWFPIQSKRLRIAK